MKIAISGINGFLGKVLAKKLNTIHTIIGIDLFESQLSDLNIKVYSINNLSLIQDSIDMIIMCHAAVASGTDMPNAKTLFEGNVLATSQLIEKFNNCRIIFISTASIFANEGIISESTVDRPLNQYSISKLWAENIIQHQNQYNIIRLSSMYGIGMKENTLIPNYINQAVNTGSISVWGDGSRKQNYIHVEDVAELVNNLIEHTIDNRLVLGIDNLEHSNLEIAAYICKQVDGCQLKFINNDTSKSLLYNNTITKNITGWKASRNLFEEINKYIKWKQK